MEKKKYHFKIEEVPHEWPEQFISGADVRAIPPGIPENMDLFVKAQGNPGRLVQNDEKVDLDRPGIEKFYSQDSNSGAGI